MGPSVVVILVAMVMVVPSEANHIALRNQVESSCVDPHGNICSNKGLCIDGGCQCMGLNTGRWCNENPYAPGLCMRTKDCVQCLAFGSGPIPQADCHRRCISSKLISDFNLVNQLRYAGKLCRFRDADDCTFHYEYYDQEDNFTARLAVNVQRDKECPNKNRAG